MASLTKEKKEALNSLPLDELVLSMIGGIPEEILAEQKNCIDSPEQGQDPTIRDLIIHLISNPTVMDLTSLTLGSACQWIPGQFVDSEDLGPDVKRLDFIWDPSKKDYKLVSSPPTVLLIGEAPTSVDQNSSRQLTKFDDAGPVSTILRALNSAGIPESACFYTTASKFANPNKKGAFPSKLLDISKPLLYAEIDKLKPKVIICLGNAALQALFGKKQTLASCRGTELTFKGYTVVPTASASSFYYSASGIEQFFAEFKKAGELARGTHLVRTIDGINYPSRDYQYSKKIEDLELWVKEALDYKKKDRWLAVDTETGTDTGRPEDAYIITSQWSYKPRHGRVFIVRDWGGRVIHSADDTQKIINLHRELFGDNETRLVGHNLRYDTQQYEKSFGLKLAGRFPRYFDTMAAFHKLCLDKEKDLGHLTLLYTDMGPYWIPMEKWVEDNCGNKGLKLFPGGKKIRYKHGFRDINYEYLLPYAACDVDSTFRCFEKLEAELLKPGNEKLRKLFYEIDMPCNRFLDEIEKNGMPVKPEKLLALSDVYWKKIGELQDEIRKLINWPEFNPGSNDHKAAFLFGGNHVFKNAEKIKATLPPGAITLGAEPVFSSGKFPKAWDKIHDSDKAATGIACDRRVLKTLVSDPKYKDQPALKKLSQYSEIVNFAKTFLARPEVDEDIVPNVVERERIAKETGDPAFKPIEDIPEIPKENSEESSEEDDDPDSYLYGRGLIACTRADKRIATNIDPLSETGRMKHRNPNMANLPKSKEANAEKVFGFEIDSVRDAFVAPDGKIIMEADYSAAEVWTMAYLGNDDALLSLLRSGADIHTSNARKFFNIGEGLTDDEFKEKYKPKRVAAKAVLFSVAYGTGADGLAQRLSIETGKPFPVEDAEQAIAGFLKTYPGVAKYLEDMKRMAINKEYVETPFGRRRYFPGVSKLSREVQSAAKREGPNMTIQGTVADMLNQAGDRLWQFRYCTALGRELDFKIMLAIHDAILVEVKKEYANVMAQVMRYCMSDTLKVPCNDPIGKLYVDVEAGPAWGDMHHLDGFDKKTPFGEWCKKNLLLLPPNYRQTLEKKAA